MTNETEAEDWEQKWIGISDMTMLNHSRKQLEQLGASNSYATVITELVNVATSNGVTDAEVETYVEESGLLGEED